MGLQGKQKRDMILCLQKERDFPPSFYLISIALLIYLEIERLPLMDGRFGQTVLAIGHSMPPIAPLPSFPTPRIDPSPLNVRPHPTAERTYKGQTPTQECGGLNEAK